MSSNLDVALNVTSDFWNQFYANTKLTHQPSAFCQWFQAQYLKRPTHLIELGCGNGRDTFSFVRNGHSVVAVDRCPVVIQKNVDFMREHGIPSNNVSFINECFSCLERLLELEIGQLTTCLYTRFVMHAITEDLEDNILDFAYNLLPKGGLMAHEFRTDKDPLKLKGELLSANERLTDHYRRFINMDSFLAKLDPDKWFIEYRVESTGLAVFAHEDPCIGRVIARRL